MDFQAPPAGLALASTTDVLTGTDATKAVTADALAAVWESGGNVTPAAAIVLGDGGYFSLFSAVASITSINFAIPTIGRRALFRVGGSAAGSVLVSSGSLVLPGGQNITLVSGDAFELIQTGPTASRVAWYTRADGKPLVSLGLRNLLINPAGAINQRSAVSAVDDAYHMDRWYALTQTAGITIASHLNGENGLPRIFYAEQSQASPQRMGLAQIIEGNNCKYLRGKQVTLSGRLKSNDAYALRYAIIEWTGTENVVTSDVVNDWTSASFTAGNFFIAGLTISGVGTIPATNGGFMDLTPLTVTLGSAFTNLIVFIWTENAVALGIQMGGHFQLEEGSAATPREFKPWDMEFAACQRYFQNRPMSYGGWASTPVVTSAGNIVFPVSMRTTPTIAGSVTADSGNNGVLSPLVPTIGGFAWYNGSNNWSVGVGHQFAYTASAEL